MSKKEDPSKVIHRKMVTKIKINEKLDNRKAKEKKTGTGNKILVQQKKNSIRTLWDPGPYIINV